MRWFPQKLKQNVIGENVNKSISIGMIVDAKSKKQLLSRLINKQMQGICYGAPTRYFEYIEAVLNIKLPLDLKNQFVEIKATRDVIFHNSGKANETYLEKAGRLARVANREKLPVTAEYFASTIASLKRLVIVLYKEVLDKYGNVEVPTDAQKAFGPAGAAIQVFGRDRPRSLVEHLVRDTVEIH